MEYSVKLMKSAEGEIKKINIDQSPDSVEMLLSRIFMAGQFSKDGLPSLSKGDIIEAGSEHYIVLKRGFERLNDSVYSDLIKASDVAKSVKDLLSSFKLSEVSVLIF